MKRIGIIIFALSILTSYGFAQTAAVSGSAYVQWGADLDNGYTGFIHGLNEMNIIVSQPVDTSAASTMSENQYYGELKISGIRLEASTENDHEDTGIQDDENIAINNPDKWDWNPGVDVDLQLLWTAIEAKIYLGPLTLQLFNNPGNTKITYNYAETWATMLENAYNYDIFAGYYGEADASNQAHYAFLHTDDETKYFKALLEPHSYCDASGIMGTLELDNFGSISLMVNSNGYNWNPNDPDGMYNEDNEYTAKLHANISTIPNTKLQAAVAHGFNVDNPFTDIGFSAQYAVNAGNVMITPVFAGDLALVPDEDLSYALTAGAKLSANGTTVTAYACTDNFDDITNSTVYTVAMDMGSVENLIVQAAWEHHDNHLLTNSFNRHAMHGKLGYAIPVVNEVVVTPSTQVSLQGRTAELNFSEMDTFVKGEILIEGLLDNTTFAFNYDSNELTQGEDKLGQFVFTTEISF